MVPLSSALAPLAASAQPRRAPGSICDRLVDPDVRALAALVASPLLVAATAAAIPTLSDDWRAQSLASRRDWLLDLDVSPQPLRDHLAGSNARQLGRYAEALWQFWFVHLPGAHLYAAGLAVKDGSAVRGEFDFIVSLPGLAGVQHLEMGYKFYLHCPPGDDFSRLFGPNPVDRLDRKWQHMLAAQLPLSQTALGRSALPAGASDVVPRACLQGWLFYPYGTAATTSIPDIAPAHWRGWWCHYDAAPRVPRRPRWTDLADSWVVLPRLAWIAPAAVRESDEPLSPAQCVARLDEHFGQSAVPQLVAGLTLDDDGVWRETVRVFVVPPSWPH